MKCIFSINMYSGNMPPERELNQEEINKVNQLISQINVPFTDKLPFGLGGPNINNYSVWWHGPNFSTESFPGPWMTVRAQKDQPLFIYRKEENFQGAFFQDTVGLWRYLNILGAPLLARHFRDHQEMMENYYEKVFRIPYQEKI